MRLAYSYARVKPDGVKADQEHMPMRCFLLSLLLACLCAANAGEVYQAPDPEPTPEETLTLELMNKFRADPKAEGERIFSEVKAGKTSWLGDGVDMDMFLQEMKALAAAPPLVFNLKLLESARKHSFYMIHNGLGHVEENGLKGYVAKEFSERIRAAGYVGNTGGENCFAKGPGIYFSHIGFIIDRGPGGTGGMQPARGHRMNMISAGFREVGAAALPDNKVFSVTHNFGARRVPRLCGGVMFMDRNNNGFYDIGEGLGGVKISAGAGGSTQSWKSGAFTLDLKNNEKATITAEFSGIAFAKTFEAGAQNIKLDWNVPEKESLDLADKLLKKAGEVANRQTPQFFNAVVELHMACGGLALDAERSNKIRELTKDVGPQLAAAQLAVREALANFDAKKFPNVLQTGQKPFTSSPAGAWFKEAGIVGTSKAALLNFERMVKTDKQYPPSQKKAFVTQLENTAKGMKIPEFGTMMAALTSQAEALAGQTKPSGK
jgi:hypothetical protein